VVTFLKNCTAAILAGGENTRMPVLKAFIEVEGQKIIERNLKIMKKSFREIFIVTNQPEEYIYLNMPLLGDIYNVRGPMTGIFTSLLNSSKQWVFISACDMPFLNRDLIEYMASKRDNSDAVVPVKKGKTEPLFAFYSKRLLASMEKSILAGKRSLKDFLNNKRVKYIKTSEIKKIDPEAKSFINLNNPEDIDLYLQPQDKIKFKSKSARRKKCLVLEQQN
jgi:molybdopterin-guanine dinucleotide biosynthesis protein A